MTLNEAAAAGISRVRLECWGPRVYGQILLTSKGYGPWLYLFDRDAQEAMKEPTPQDVLIVGAGAESGYVEYTGELDKADKMP